MLINEIPATPGVKLSTFVVTCCPSMGGCEMYSVARLPVGVPTGAHNFHEHRERGELSSGVQ